MFTRKSRLSQEDKKSAIILINISFTITIWLSFKYFINPQQFITHYLGIEQGIFNNLTYWLLTLTVAVCYIIYTIIFIPFVRKRLFVFSHLKLLGIWVAFTSSTVEELFFRKRLMDWLSELNISAVIQVLVSAVIFGLAHSAWGLLRGEVKVILPVVLATTILGAALAILYLLTERNILAPMIAHILINLLIEPWLILAAVSGKWEGS